ncbi:MAG: hypothetical protein IKY83_04460 [Proteobacteria bacterium]|nr:hypothetical protein [Pseudomonadota bacterium]
MGLFGSKVTSKNAMDKIEKGKDDSKYMMDLYIRADGQDNVGLMFDLPNVAVGGTRDVLPKDILSAVGQSYEHLLNQGYTTLSFQKKGFMRGSVDEPYKCETTTHDVLTRVRLTGQEIKAAFTYINAKRTHSYTPNYNSATFATHVLKAAGISLPSKLHELSVKEGKDEKIIRTRRASKEGAIKDYEADAEKRIAQKRGYYAESLKEYSLSNPLERNAAVDQAREESSRIRAERDRIIAEKGQSEKEEDKRLVDEWKVKTIMASDRYDGMKGSTGDLRYYRGDMETNESGIQNIQQRSVIGYQTWKVKDNEGLSDRLKHAEDLSERKEWTLYSTAAGYDASSERDEDKKMMTRYTAGKKISSVGDENHGYHENLVSRFQKKDVKK